jgi:hypothetical protein
LPANGDVDRNAVQRRFSSEQVRVGPQFVRINRRTVKDRWVTLLRGVLEALGTREQMTENRVTR